MSIAIMTDVWKLDIEKIAKFVLVKIADNANEATGIAYPSVAYLVAFCGMSERTVQRILSDFVKSGVLVIVGYEKGGRRPREYVIDLEKARKIHGVVDWKYALRGASVAPLKSDDEESRGASVAPLKDDHKADGCQPGTPGMPAWHPRGATAMAPEPSINRHGKEASPPGVPPVDGDAAMAVRLWNSLATRIELPIVQLLTKARRKALQRRLAECGGLEGWQAALSKVEGSAFLRGDNDRGWRADFDFILQAKSFARVMEGCYDRKGRSGGGGGRQSAHATLFAAGAQVGAPPADRPDRGLHQSTGSASEGAEPDAE